MGAAGQQIQDVLGAHNGEQERFGVAVSGGEEQIAAGLTQVGGDLFFSTINRNPKSFLFAIVGAEYILNLLPRGTHEYDKLIKPSELARWIREAGLDMREMMGMTYNPLTKRYRLTPDDVSVNYLIRAKKP